MFKSKIKYLPSRMGDRTDSTMINNNAKKYFVTNQQKASQHILKIL